MSAPKLRSHALGERLAREQDALLERHPGAATFRGAARVATRRPRAVVIAVAAFAMVLAAAIVLFVRARPLDLTIAGEAGASGSWVSAPRDTPVPLLFSDGTSMLLAPEGHARVVEITRKGAHLMLESGTARVSVTPNRGGRWTFTAGPFQVEVKGTRFELAWSPREQLFTLTLLEGSVVVSGCAVGEGRQLFAGETLSASCLQREFHIDHLSSPDASPSPSLASAAPAPPPPAAPASSTVQDAIDPASPKQPSPTASQSRPRAAPGETWQSLARASRFKEALARVNERGFDAELADAGRDDALLLGDVARLGGDPDRALVAYQRVRSRAPGTEAAANAAFSMGRVYFDQRGAYADAARSFSIYRSERRNGPLARDAMGRQMEALARAGARAAAARLADEYLLAYPSGPHAALARSLREGAR